MIDLHCHILPGVDDGAPDVETALEMARVLVRAGFTHVAASPHLGAGPGGDVSLDSAAAARAELATALESAAVPLVLLPNAEHHVSAELFERLERGAVVPIGGAGKWLLVEMPWAPVSDVEGVLFRLQTKGWRLLLAHPERYSYVELDTLARLVERGVKLQLELGSFTGLYGQRANFKALALADRGLAHILATDIHRPKDVDGWLPAALRLVADRYGKRAALLGTRENPEAMLAGAASDALAPFTVAR